MRARERAIGCVWGILLAGVSLACADDRALAPDGCKLDLAPGDAGVRDAAAVHDDSFTAVYSLVLGRACPDCHKPDGLASFLDLSSPDVAYRSLVGVGAAADGVCASYGPRVAPGDCASSLLFHKLNGEEQRCGSRMPLREPPFQQPYIDLVCRWIEAGAACD